MNLDNDTKEDSSNKDNNTENFKQNTNNINENNNQNRSQNNIELINKEINDICNEQQRLIKKNSFIQKKDYFELEISLFKEMIQTEKNISLLIIIPFNYPKSEPEIYCLTEFCSPHICDGRNLLYDIIKTSWQRKIHTIDFVINKLPGFFLTFNETRKKNKNLIIGKFVLNKYYSINRLKELPIYFHLIILKEKKFTFKTIKTHKIITISEISFCMFELDNNYTGYCKLIFFADLKDLISTKLDNKKSEIEIKWKNPENDKKNIKIELISTNSENINNILIKNQAEFFKKSNSFNNCNNEENIKKNINERIDDITNYDSKNNIKDNHKESKNEKNINENKIENKSININMVEKQIIYVEKSINIGNRPNKDQLNYLMKLYQNAITYYSEIDKEKYNFLKNKMDKLNQIKKTIENKTNNNQNIKLEINRHNIINKEIEEMNNETIKEKIKEENKKDITSLEYKEEEIKLENKIEENKKEIEEIKIENKLEENKKENEEIIHSKNEKENDLKEDNKKEKENEINNDYNYKNDKIESQFSKENIKRRGNKQLPRK